MSLTINEHKLASAITMLLTQKRDYHTFLLANRYAFFSSEYSPRLIRLVGIDINEEIRIRDINWQHNAHNFCLEFSIAIDNKNIAQFFCMLNLNPKNNNFGCWSTRSVIDKKVLQPYTSQIVSWYENIRNSYHQT